MAIGVGSGALVAVEWQGCYMPGSGRRHAWTDAGTTNQTGRLKCVCDECKVCVRLYLKARRGGASLECGCGATRTSVSGLVWLGWGGAWWGVIFFGVSLEVDIVEI